MSFWQNNLETFNKYGHTKNPLWTSITKKKTNISPTSCKKEPFSQWTNPGNQFAWATEFFMLAPNIRSSTHNPIHVIVLKPGIWWQLLDFWKTCSPLIWARYYPYLDLQIKFHKQFTCEFSRYPIPPEKQWDNIYRTQVSTQSQPI